MEIHGFPHDLQRLDRSGFAPDSLFAIDLAIEVAHHQLHTTPRLSKLSDMSSEVQNSSSRSIAKHLLAILLRAIRNPLAHKERDRRQESVL